MYWRSPNFCPCLVQKRPHLCLSRKLSYSSALRDAQAIASNSASNPPSPGFPSVLTVASSLASSLRAPASASASACRSDGGMPEDHFGNTLSPQDLHSQNTCNPTQIMIHSGSSSSSSIIPTKKRIESLKRSLASCASSTASISQIVLEDFLNPRPSTSRASSSDSFYTDPYIRIDSEGPDSRPITSSGLVCASDVDSDAMDEDVASTLQRTSPHHQGLTTSSAYPNENSSPISASNRQVITRSFLLSPSGKGNKGSGSGGIRYSMGIKKGCPKCERGEKGHFTHLGND